MDPTRSASRNVIRVGVPEWSLRLVAGILVLGIPLALVFSWIYELTPEGLKRESDLRATGPYARAALDGTESLPRWTWAHPDIGFLDAEAYVLDGRADDAIQALEGKPGFEA